MCDVHRKVQVKKLINSLQVFHYNSIILNKLYNITLNGKFKRKKKKVAASKLLLFPPVAYGIDYLKRRQDKPTRITTNNLDKFPGRI